MRPESRRFDERPGPVPEIRAEGDSVIFCLDVTSEQARLILRCDPDGSVRASIFLDEPREAES